MRQYIWKPPIGCFGSTYGAFSDYVTAVEEADSIKAEFKKKTTLLMEP